MLFTPALASLLATALIAPSAGSPTESATAVEAADVTEASVDTLTFETVLTYERVETTSGAYGDTCCGSRDGCCADGSCS
jgi:hypothetical protein